MNVHISYKVQKTPDIEKEINHQTEKLRKRLQVFRPELIHLKGTLEENSARVGTAVSLNLRLPSGQMAVQKSAANATAAIKAAFEDLLQQILLLETIDELAGGHLVLALDHPPGVQMARTDVGGAVAGRPDRGHQTLPRIASR